MPFVRLDVMLSSSLVMREPDLLSELHCLQRLLSSWPVIQASGHAWRLVLLSRLHPLSEGVQL
ncbi:hypothetical protein AZE42_05394 [Rhizopogon vesiculosus]|uniref:Uncharacterized protein n=1 Tax=Rhizopogon vesiculosus TaxID=180088 RepID=A0A1J8QJZ3_9AGAM|nr:hypothetical protein AZE42_05394 [Rhizopogon vesiculosus]